MHNLTNILLKISALLIALGAILVVSWLDPSILHLSSLSDVAEFYVIYFFIVAVSTVPFGIVLGMFDRLLDELSGY
jgi:hypothetical protein